MAATPPTAPGSSRMDRAMLVEQMLRVKTLRYSRMNLLHGGHVFGSDKLVNTPEELLEKGVLQEDIHKVMVMQLKRSFALSAWTRSPLAAFTLPTTFLSLSQSEVIALYQHALDTQTELPSTFNPDPKIPTIDSSELLWTISHLKGRITSAIAQFEGNKCFVKLDTRSPKDSLVYDSEMPMVKHALSKSFQSMALHNQQSVNMAFFKGVCMAFAVEDGEQALELMCRSFQCLQDLGSNALYPAEGETFAYIAVRQVCQELIDRPQHQFRCFVHNSKLTAVTQYFDWIYDPELAALKEHIGKLLVEFFEEHVRPAVAMESYVYDVYLAKSQTMLLIEFNPFSKGISPGLFSWKNPVDAALLESGPFQFRVVEAPLAPALQMEVIPSVWSSYVSTLLKQYSHNAKNIALRPPDAQRSQGHGLDKPQQCDLQ